MEITEGLKNKVASFPNPPASKINSKETYKQDTSPFLKEGTKGTIFMSFKKKKKQKKTRGELALSFNYEGKLQSWISLG